MSVRILTGDCRDVLATLPADSVQCCVTSPPYFGLRDYGNAAQIGLEPTPDAYVAEMVAVFREVRRVLRADGTCWLNIGDSYASTTKGDNRQNAQERPRDAKGFHSGSGERWASGTWKVDPQCKPKDIIGIPWLLAFALRADGWYLRQEIIWHKPNPMPESVTDRCTKAHESVFLLTKSARYYFDAKAIAEDSCATDARHQTKRARELADAAGLTDQHIAALRACGVGDAGKAQATQSGYGRNDPAVQALADEAKRVLGGYTREFLISETRNRRSVWTIATQPYSGSHFATMPPELAETCIKAGTKPGDMVLDPFGGAGTTALVADRLQRDATIIELNPEYAQLARERISSEAGLFSSLECVTGNIGG